MNETPQEERYRPSQSRHGGKLVIVITLILTVCGTGFALWWRNHQQRRCLELWGSDVAMQISFSPKSELLLLGDASPASKDTLQVDGVTKAILQRVQVNHHKPIQDVRKALVRDDYFDWQKSLGDQPPDWKYALRLTDGEKQTVILFDFSRKCVRALNIKRETSIAPMARHMQPIFEELFGL